MTKEQVVTGIEAFNTPSCFEFWYGADYEAICQAAKRPSERQRLFLMSLISNLHLPLKRYGVNFPYENVELHHYLLKPKKRFLNLSDYAETQVLMDSLKRLPRQFEVYQKAPCVATYLTLEKELKTLLLYFSIPKEKQFFEQLKKKVPVRYWKAHETEQREKEWAAKSEILLEKWKETFIQEWNAQHPPLRLEPEVLKRAISRFKTHYPEGARFISTNQKEKLIALYQESLAWLSLFNEPRLTSFSPYSLYYFDFLTFKEAGVLTEAFEHLNQCLRSYVRVTAESPLTLCVSTTYVPHELLQLLNMFSTHFPHVKELTRFLQESDLASSSSISSLRLLKTQAMFQSLESKTNYLLDGESFNGISGFPCASDELQFCLELQAYLTAQFETNKPTHLPDLMLDDLLTFIHQSPIVQTLNLSDPDFLALDDWRFLTTGTLDGAVVSYFQLLQEQLFADQTKQTSQALLYEEMLALLESLPMAKIGD